MPPAGFARQRQVRRIYAFTAGEAADECGPIGLIGPLAAFQRFREALLPAWRAPFWRRPALARRQQSVSSLPPKWPSSPIHHRRDFSCALLSTVWMIRQRGNMESESREIRTAAIGRQPAHFAISGR